LNKFGSWKELFRLIFRKESTNEQITILPNSTVDYDATASLELPQNASSDVMVSRESADQAGGRLKNKDLEADTTRLADQTDATKLAKFDLSSNTTGTTRTYVVPDSDTQLVGTDTTDTLENKTLTSPVLNTSLSGTALNTDLDATAESDKVPTAAATKLYADSVSGDVQTNLDDHINDVADAHAASAITNTPAGLIAATTVQAAIDELDSEKLARDGSQAMTGNLDLGTNSIDNVGGVVLEDSNSIDTDTSSGVVTIGGTNANQVDIGRSGQTTRVRGNLQVDGTTTTVNSTTLDVTDENITVNNGGNQAAADTLAGLTVEMSDADDAKLLYDSTASSKWRAGDAVSTSPILTANSTDTLTNKTIDADGTGNSITNLEDANIKSGAAIDATKIANGSVSNTEFEKLDGTSGALIDENSTQTMAAKTLTSPVLNTPTANSPVLNTAVSGTAVLDDNTFTTASATTLATSESIKQYVDNQVSAGASGSGSGEINYIENGLFNVDVTGWTLYQASATPPSIADTAGASTPVQLTFAQDSSTHVIEGSASGRLSHTGSTENNNGISYDFSIPVGQQAQTQKVELSYYTTDLALAGQLRLYIVKDVSGIPSIEELQILPFGTTDANSNRYKVRATFKALDGIADYRLVLHHGSTAFAWNLNIDSIVVGPESATVVPGFGKDGNLINFGTSEGVEGWSTFQGSNTPPATYSETNPFNLSPVTLIKTASDPIWGNFTKVVTFESGSTTDGVQSEFTLPRALESTLLALDFDYYVGNLGTRTTGDIKVMFVGEDDTVVYPSQRDLVLPTASSTSLLKYRSSVALPTAQKWRLVIQNTTAVATTTSIAFDGVYLGTRNGAQQGFDGIWKPYTESDVSITSAQGGFTVVGATFIPKKLSDGNWILSGSGQANYTATTISSLTIAFAGLSFKTGITQEAGMSLGGNASNQTLRGGYAIGATGNIQIQVVSTGNTSQVYWSFADLLLDSKPTWADFDPIATVYPTTDDLALSGWQSYTPTASASFSTSAASGAYRRVGDSIEVIVKYILSSGVSGAMVFTDAQILPNGLTWDDTVIPDGVSVGTWEGFDSSAASTANNFSGTVQFNYSVMALIIPSSDSVDNTDPFTWASGDTVAIKFTTPIAEWSDLGQVPPVGIQLATPTQYGLVQLPETGTITLAGNGRFSGVNIVLSYVKSLDGNFVTLTHEYTPKVGAGASGNDPSISGAIPVGLRPLSGVSINGIAFTNDGSGNQASTIIISDTGLFSVRNGTTANSWTNSGNAAINSFSITYRIVD
jgi:hypothetical protein